MQSALNTAKRNKVVGGDVSINAADVTFPVGPAGQSDRIQVWVYRTKARGTQIPTLIGPVFGVNDFDIMNTLFTDPMGKQMLMGAAVMQTVGYFWIRQVIKIEV